MKPTEQSADAIRLMLLEEINRERDAGFPQLRQVPSTHALKVLRYFDTLDSESTRACYALPLNPRIRFESIRHANAMKCSPATVAGSRS